jgi:hypothetical protein
MIVRSSIGICHRQTLNTGILYVIVKWRPSTYRIGLDVMRTFSLHVLPEKLVVLYIRAHLFLLIISLESTAENFVTY